MGSTTPPCYRAAVDGEKQYFRRRENRVSPRAQQWADEAAAYDWASRQTNWDPCQAKAAAETESEAEAKDTSKDESNADSAGETKAAPEGEAKK